jgi:methylthioribose-1-phosphate isomerase
MRMWFTLKFEGGKLLLLDQLKLPNEEVYVSCSSCAETAEAIRTMVVRGAPAIGVAAAYGVVLGALKGEGEEAVFSLLAATRPTAMNLFWALARMRLVWKASSGDAAHLEAEARAIEKEDVTACLAIGRHGADLLAGKTKILTICNAGALATAGIGTALGVIRTLHRRNPAVEVFALETRPYLQGARLTAWELQKDGIPVTVLTDNMAGWAMRTLGIEAVVTGADRIAANGDTANKIGTYTMAVLARHHGIPLYVAAPTSTLDPALASGDSIPIEHRPEAEVRSIAGREILPAGVSAWHPAFDVTPFSLISGIITEKGLFTPHGHAGH